MATIAPDPIDLARMGIPVADWGPYQVASQQGPSAPIPEQYVAQAESLVAELLTLGLPLAVAVPTALEMLQTGLDGGQPGGSITPPATQSPAEMIARLPVASPGSGLGGPAPGTTTEPSGWGTTTPEQRSALSLGSLGLGTIGRIGTMVGVPAMGLTSMATMPVNAALVADLIGRVIGLPGYEPNPLVGVPSLSDIQGIQDTFGAYAANEAATNRQSAIDAYNEQVTRDEMGYLSAISPADLARNPAGWGSNPFGPPTPSVTNPDAPAFGESGLGPSGPSGSTSGPGSPGGFGSGTPGGEPGDPDSGWARGGVATFSRPTRPLVGEAGTETGIFIPQAMDAPGMQMNEAAVRQALAGSLLRLLFADQRGR